MSKICIIGAGAMGYAFAQGVVSAKLYQPSDVLITDLEQKKLNDASANIGINTSTNNVEAIKDADVILLALKPNILDYVLADIGDRIKKEQILISIAAGVKISSIGKWVPDEIGIIRAMPNTSIQIKAGAIGFCRGKSVTDAQVEQASKIFEAVGICYEVEEKLMDAITGLSGSGPAYAYMMIEALSDGGIAVGLPRKAALRLAAQTVMGAAQMVLELGEHPAHLKDLVASPGGTTIAGIEALEKAGFRSALIEAVKAASARALELG